MTRLHYPASIPGLLGTPIEGGTPLVLTPAGYVRLGVSGSGGELPDGVNPDDMLFWDGAQWIPLPPGGPPLNSYYVATADFLHANLPDVTSDQHHPKLHDLNSHTDVSAPAPIDDMRIAWDDTLSQWIPKQSRSALGIVTFKYRVLTTPDATPISGKLSGNNTDPALLTILYIHREDNAGQDRRLFLGSLEAGSWINVHEDNDAANHRSFDVTGNPTQVGDVFHVPVVFFDQAGDPLVNNERVQLFMRFTHPQGFDGAHSSLSNILPDDHHAKYTDQEAIDAVGPIPPQVPQTYLHNDLIDILPDQHHARYTDGEATAAVGPHFSGDHGDLGNVLSDDHHVRYTDGEAVTAVGPHFSGEHGDLTLVGSDDHHPRYTDQEAIDAVDAGKHTISTTAPIGPDLGDVWVNPDEPPEVLGPALVQVIVISHTFVGATAGGNFNTSIDLTAYSIADAANATVVIVGNSNNSATRRAAFSYDNFSATNIRINSALMADANTGDSIALITIHEYDRAVN